MSTILKTLRKLEEEKNILNQKLDLKEMLLKEDTAYPKPIKSDRRKIFLIIITVLLVIGGTSFHQWEPKPEITSLRKQVLNKKPIPQTTLPSKGLSRLSTFEGVPMEAILPDELAPTKPDKNIPVKRKGKLLPEKTPKITIPSEIEKIQTFIQSTTNLAKPHTVLPTAIQSGSIPGIKVKGIIFFDKDSLSNHIIATTESNSNLKLRVGETAQDAVLKSIYPNYVIFLYRNQLIQVSIGR